MMFSDGQIVLWEGRNCPKKFILSMQRHRHTAHVMLKLSIIWWGQIIVSEPLGGVMTPLVPLGSAHGSGLFRYAATPLTLSYPSTLYTHLSVYSVIYSLYNEADMSSDLVGMLCCCYMQLYACSWEAVSYQ